MDESDRGQFSLRAAAVNDKSRFCIVVGQLSYDDPFSAIITFDGSQSQPWERFDIQREIVCVTALAIDPSRKNNRYCALSNEGDVYYLGGHTHREKIIGAGHQSEDSTGLGATFAIAQIANRLIAAGESNQVYHRHADGTWVKDFPSEGRPDDRYELAGYGSISGSATGIYISGVAYPRDNSLRAIAAQRFDSWDDADEALEKAEKAKTLSHTPVPHLVYLDDGQWQVIPAARNETVNDILAESSSKVWMVGSNGLLQLGNAAEGFRDLSFRGDRTRNLISIAKFREDIIVASDYELHRFDGHILSPLKPRLRPEINRNIPTPLMVQAVDDVMFYFDYKHGVHRWDGETWEEIVIPPELLERGFKGLRSSR